MSKTDKKRAAQQTDVPEEQAPGQTGEESGKTADEGTPAGGETPAAAKPAEPTELEKMTAELEKTAALAEDYKRKWYAVTAEYDNYRKRTSLTASQKYAEGKADVLSKIFPIGDNIDRALAVCNDEKMKQGLEMVKNNFDKILSDEGVESFDPTGEEFNSATSAAIAAQPAAEGEAEGIVRQTFLKGYKKGDKILRYAQVVVTR